MSNRRVLFIVEGQKDEPRFLKMMHRLLLGTKPDNIHILGRSIHQLLKTITIDGHIDDDLDLVSVLMEDADQNEQRTLAQEFTDVYLVFDMDPQDTAYDDQRLLAAMEHFSDSTGNGKLYLNYPMIESYRHLWKPYDMDYLYRTVSMDEIRQGYKQLVDIESYPQIKDLGKYDAEVLMMIIDLNLCKINGILRGCFEIPGEEEYLGWDFSRLLGKQIDLLQSENSVYVVNTSALIAVDYNPRTVLGQLTASHHD